MWKVKSPINDGKYGKFNTCSVEAFKNHIDAFVNVVLIFHKVNADC